MEFPAEPIDALVFTGDEAAELRELLFAPEGVNEHALFICARNQRTTRDALFEALALPADVRLQMRLVLEGDFEQTFAAALQLGLAHERDRGLWARRFNDDPDAALIDLRRAGRDQEPATTRGAENG